MKKKLYLHPLTRHSHPKVIDQILKEDQMEVPRRSGHRAGETVLAPDLNRPRGIFNKVMISPDEWRQVRDIIEILQVRVFDQVHGCRSIKFLLLSNPLLPGRSLKT